MVDNQMADIDKVKLNRWQKGRRVQWVRDLISGDFQQGRGVLKATANRRDDDTRYVYCCLGVACERFAPNAPDLIINEGENASSSFLSPEIASKFGFVGGAGLYGQSSHKLGDQDTAAGWNDGESVSFVRIADFVAWATEHKLRFSAVDEVMDEVPVGYATEWLKQFN